MLETFAQAFCLRNAYKKNGFLWSLKSIPLIKKLLPASLYASRGLGVFANIVSGILEVVNAFCGKAFYLLLVYMLAEGIKVGETNTFAHMLIFLTLIGGFLNTRIFEPTRDKFYAIFLMRMDARKYTLTDYFYFLLKLLVGLTAFSLLFGRMLGVSYLTCLLYPVYVLCVKLCFTVKNLRDCQKKSKTFNENKPNWAVWVCVAVLLAATAIPFAGIVLPEYTLWILTGVLLVPAILAARYILRFDAYRPIYKELLKLENYVGNSGINAQTAAQQLAMQKKISADVSQTSKKSGYKYFNELFMKRHAKLLTKSAKRFALAFAALFAAAALALHFFPSAKPNVNALTMNYLPYFLFVLYFVNRGRTITQAMFMNCDHSMLAYRAYRQPKAILTLFVERLKYVILINLMPASVIGLGLPLLLYLSGGTTQPLNYAVLFVSIIAMSVFFSVHSMVLYYLLQPYNVNLESKSGTYSIINWLTYMACYVAIQFQAPTLYFGIAISAFCILYAVVAFILAYRLAPKTFKLRN